MTRAQDMQATVGEKYSSLQKALQAAGGSTEHLMQDVAKHTQQQQDQLAAHVQVCRKHALAVSPHAAHKYVVLCCIPCKAVFRAAIIVDGIMASATTHHPL